MRPASDVAKDICACVYADPVDGIASIIQRDREELVREICEWLQTRIEMWASENPSFGGYSIAKGNECAIIKKEIERKYLKGSSDGR